MDINVFSDYQNFTKIQPTADRFSLSMEQGGFKVVGNLVYIYAVINPDKTKFGTGYDFWTINNDGALLKPKLPQVPLTVYDQYGVFTHAKIALSGTTSYISLCGIAQNYQAQSSNAYVVLQGIYEKA